MYGLAETKYQLGLQKSDLYTESLKKKTQARRVNVPCREINVHQKACMCRCAILTSAPPNGEILWLRHKHPYGLSLSRTHIHTLTIHPSIV